MLLDRMSHDCLSMALVVSMLFGGYYLSSGLGAILFANHKANGVVTNIGLSR